LGGYDYERQTQRIVLGLGFKEEDLDKPASAFSGGQKTRINLAKALVRQPDFLFLDEPTNHLDMEMLEWLENYLLSYKGGILVVSHDRYFLDRIVTGVVELDHHKTRTYRGNYSRYLKQKEANFKANLKAYEKQQEEIKKTEAYIDKYRAGIKSKMARGRQSQLDRLERLEAPETSHNLSFSFPKAAMSADKVLVLDRVSYAYQEGHPVFEEVSFVIRRGEAVALIGANGAGKSTLVKTIVGDLHPSQGFVDVGNRVQVGYFSQEHEELHDHWEVLDEIVNNFGFKEEEARKALGSFMFRGDDVFKKVGDLSGGEKARLALLKLFLQGNNFLILDEPTNHLDIPTREIVEEALKNFDGTCLVISHDRYFLDQVAKRIIDLEKGHILDFQGNFTDFKEALNQGRIHLPGQENRGVVESVPASINEPKNSSSAGAMTKLTNPEKQKAGLLPELPEEGKANPKKEAKPNDYMREKKLGQVETEIARLEATIKMYEVQLMNPAVQADNDQMASLASNIEQANSELEALYE
ncbi:MAG: ABC-F family ATP-binding cassette domain-containing protein, partial [Veillonella sp.]|nr:ABC-F family ATP-binding cassette domain-containing protein [Veillonella sp.]